MTTNLIRLLQAKTGTDLITSYFTKNNLNEHSFTDAKSGSHEYMVRAAILKEFEAVAENLHFSQKDPIRKTHKDFWPIEKDMYGMRDIIAHKYGVTNVDYKVIWDALNPNGKLVKDVLPVINEMIKEHSGPSK